MQTTEERQREDLYWTLFAEFGEIAHALHGWHSVEGILLDSKLKFLAERLRLVGVKPESIVRRRAMST